MKITKSQLKSIIHEVIEESKTSQEQVKYSVALQGGTIGEINIMSKQQLKGIKAKDIFPLYDSKSEALEYVSRLNKQLSPGEKKYYNLKYIVVEVDSEGNYTGR